VASDEQLSCDVCGRPGREFCTDCNGGLTSECNAEQAWYSHHDCPDCRGHRREPRHDEGYVACPNHEEQRLAEVKA
jgi:hypothetical protein